jgi:cyclopropane-fatty-acyl-phospholipid synthase
MAQAQRFIFERIGAVAAAFTNWIMARALSRIVTHGSLDVTTSNGRLLSFGDASGEQMHVRFADLAAQWAFLIDADMRLGELYMDRRFLVEHGSLYDFLAMMLREAQNARHPLVARLIDGARTRLRTFRHRNLPTRSKANVAHHYDLDGRLYELFLDADRQYSCAYFEKPDQSLDGAQLAKKRHLAAKLQIAPGDRVLDIGCGWGGLALHVADHARGVHVLGITLSEEQHAYAMKRAAEHGESSAAVEFALQDYRSLTGRFDRIVSVGMFEHVGIGNYGNFFRKVSDLLDDNGVMVLHSIGRPKPSFGTNAFIEKYIFPGGYIPSVGEVVPPLEKAGLLVKDIEILPLHYAYTLRHWRERFVARKAEAVALYDEQFFRMWEFYLAGSEMGFRWDELFIFQIQIAKNQFAVPDNRNYIERNEAKLKEFEATRAPLEKVTF